MEPSNPRNQLTAVDYRVDSLHFKHIKFQQTVGDIPVWGSYLTVHFNSSNAIYRISGRPYPGLDDINTSPALTKQKAAEAAAHAGQEQSGDWQPGAVLLYVLPEESGAKLVYEVTVTKGLTRKFVFIDANSGQLVKTLSGTPTLQR